MKPTLKQLQLAGKIYGLALVAQANTMCVDKLSIRVAHYAKKHAEKQLAYLGLWASDITDEQSALQCALELVP